ncbi:MAG: biotin--[acetyl-CoA-carboxylase] ligase [Gammaproteobacteria bacterium]
MDDWGLRALVAALCDGQAHSRASVIRSAGIDAAALESWLAVLPRYGVSIEPLAGGCLRLAQALDLLDRDSIYAALPPDTRDIVRRCEVCSCVDSTNQVLLERAAHEDIHGHVCLAEFQTAGRGRQGRRWHMPYGGGILMSIGWRYAQRQVLAPLALAIGVAAVRVLCRNGAAELRLKWPNDLLWHGRKLGGFLIEARGAASGPVSAIIGLGINCTPAADLAVAQPRTDVWTVLGHALSRNALAAQLIAEVSGVLSEHGARRGYSVLLNEWRQHAAQRGQPVRLVQGDKTLCGEIRDVDDQGALIVDIDGRLRRFQDGEISLRAAE